MYGALLPLVYYMAGETEGFWFVNPMFHTVTQLMTVHVGNNLADQIHGSYAPNLGRVLNGSKIAAGRTSNNAVFIPPC